jgi:serine/threonine protein kinase
MIFPSITEYRDALRFQGTLKKYSILELVTDSKGQPCFSCGNFSVVFRMKDKTTKKEYAVKCFTRDQERRQKSYELISQNLNKLNSPYLVHYEYLPDEVWVNSRTAGNGDFPAVVMEWVESITLGAKLAELCRKEDKTGIFDLACTFDRMALWLMDQSFAHGDLKTDNILIETNGAMRLIDYDGMFTPEMTGENARENGSPGFRHPKRSANHFGPHIDDFSILLISLSLHALAENPKINYQYNFGDAILLDEAALNSLGEGKLWELLDSLRSNNEVSQRLVMLYMATGNPAEMRLFGMSSILKNTALKAPEPININYHANDIPELIPYRKGNLWGYCDRNKKIIINCNYWEVGLFQNGIAKVYKNWKYGFINRIGEEIIQIKYDQVWFNHGGYLRLILRDLYGLSNHNGRMIVPCVYDNVCDYFEGFAAVQKDKKWGFINHLGEEIINCKFDNVGRFINGFARICYVDHQLLNAKKNLPSGFGNLEHETWGFVDRLGKEDFTGKKGPVKISLFESMDINNSRFYQSGNDVLTEVNSFWKESLKHKYDHISDFSYGLAGVKSRGKWGFINKHGIEVIACKYDDDTKSHTFIHGLSRIKLNGLEGYIDSLGTEYWENGESNKIDENWEDWERINLVGRMYNEYYDLKDIDGIIDGQSQIYGGASVQEIINIDGKKNQVWLIKILSDGVNNREPVFASVIPPISSSISGPQKGFKLKQGIAKFSFGNLTKGQGILLAFGLNYRYSSSDNR